MSLQKSIQALADTFAQSVVKAIRTATLDDVLAEGARFRGPQSAASARPAKRGPGRPAKKIAGGGGQPDPLHHAKPKTGKGGRLARRSPEDIEKVIGSIVGVLAKAKDGLRSEQLQKTLKLDKREISGPLAQALAAKKITKKGEKRATTYFAK